MKYKKGVKEIIDKRYKPKKYFRISENLKIQFSDKKDKERGFIGLTKNLLIN